MIKAVRETGRTRRRPGAGPTTDRRSGASRLTLPAPGGVSPSAARILFGGSSRRFPLAGSA